MKSALRQWSAATLALLVFQSPQSVWGHYDPQTQRWINRDPIHELGALNDCSFVFNGPINRLDPTGLSAEQDCMSQCLGEFVGDLKTFCGIVAGCGVAALGNIPGKSGRPIAVDIGRFAFRESMRGAGPTPGEYFKGRALAGQNAAGAARAAAVVGAFMAGYGAGAFIQCAQRCYGGPGLGSPLININAPPTIVIRGPVIRSLRDVPL